MSEIKENKEPLNKNNKVPKLRFKSFNDSWIICNFLEHFDTFSTNSLSWDQLNFNDGEIRNLHYGIIHANSNNIIESNTLPYINFDSIPKKYTLVVNGDLILADTSEDRIDSAKGIEISNDSSEKVISGLHTIHLREKKNHTIIGYKTYFVASKGFRHFARKYCEGIKVFSIKPSLLKYATFSYPNSIDEQQKIVDLFAKINIKINLIESKISTLKKYKRGYAISNIKSLYINDKIPLSKLCEITTGKLDANAMIDNGKYKFFTCAKEDYLIDYYAFDCEALLISGNGEVGLTKYYYGKFNAYQRTYVLHDFKMNPKFIKMCIDSQIKSIIKKETNKGAMPYIKLSTFDKIFIPIIDTKNEEILVKNITILDKKIELLECTLKTLNLLKKQLLNSMFI